MKKLNKILTVIIVLYFFSLFLLLIGCLIFPSYSESIFNIFIKTLLLFRFLLAILLVAFISNVTTFAIDKGKKRKIKNNQEVTI